MTTFLEGLIRTSFVPRYFILKNPSRQVLIYKQDVGNHQVMLLDKIFNYSIIFIILIINIQEC
jgi:hypothetical protein